MEEVLAKVTTFGGHVVELSANRLVAAFGLEPIEEAPQHAALAAVAARQLAERSAGKTQFVVALHSEELSVRRIGDRVEIDADEKRAACGVLDTLIDRAASTAILATAPAAALLRHGFNLLSAGSDEPATGPIHLLVAPRTETDLREFIGRTQELRLLEKCFAQAVGGQGQLVLLVGEPGIGKSRLLLELRRRLNDPTVWNEGRAMSFGQTMPFHPLIDLCRRRFGIEERDTDADIVAKIDDHVAGLGHDLTSATPFIRHLLSVDPGEPSVATMDPKLRRAEVFNAVLRLLQCAAEKAPQIVVLEDAHWMDQATTEFLTQLADAIAMTRLLLVVSHRPGYTPPFGDRSFHTRMALQALSPADSAAMASALLGAKELPAELEALIARKAEGNPFFVEEIVQSLKELKAVRRVDGTLVVTEELGQIEVPDTIQELILARIERLDEQPKSSFSE